MCLHIWRFLCIFISREILISIFFHTFTNLMKHIFWLHICRLLHIFPNFSTYLRILLQIEIQWHNSPLTFANVTAIKIAPTDSYCLVRQFISYSSRTSNYLAKSTKNWISWDCKENPVVAVPHSTATTQATYRIWALTNWWHYVSMCLTLHFVMAEPPYKPLETWDLMFGHINMHYPFRLSYFCPIGSIMQQQHSLEVLMKSIQGCWSGHGGSIHLLNELNWRERLHKRTSCS